MGLILAGLAGAAFFVLTDPRIGWLKSSRSSDNVIDAIQSGSIATWIGLAGSGVVVVIGLWLAMRRKH